MLRELGARTSYRILPPVMTINFPGDIFDGDGNNGHSRANVTVSYPMLCVEQEWLIRSLTDCIVID